MPTHHCEIFTVDLMYVSLCSGCWGCSNKVLLPRAVTFQWSETDCKQIYTVLVVIKCYGEKNKALRKGGKRDEAGWVGQKGCLTR